MAPVAPGKQLSDVSEYSRSDLPGGHLRQPYRYHYQLLPYHTTKDPAKLAKLSARDSNSEIYINVAYNLALDSDDLDNFLAGAVYRVTRSGSGGW